MTQRRKNDGKEEGEGREQCIKHSVPALYYSDSQYISERLICFLLLKATVENIFYFVKIIPFKSDSCTLTLQNPLFYVLKGWLLPCKAACFGTPSHKISNILKYR